MIPSNLVFALSASLLILVSFLIILFRIVLALSRENEQKDARIGELESEVKDLRGDLDSAYEAIDQSHDAVSRLGSAMATSLSRYANESCLAGGDSKRLYHNFIDQLRRFANVAGCIEIKLRPPSPNDDIEAEAEPAE